MARVRGGSVGLGLVLRFTTTAGGGVVFVADGGRDFEAGDIAQPTRLAGVLAAAVNLAARIEGLCNRPGRNSLFSGALARHIGTPSVPLGAQPLKGLPDPQPVYGLADT